MSATQLNQKHHTHNQLTESGIRWLGQIPSSWNLLPVRAVLTERVEKNRKLAYDNILSVMRNVGVIRYVDKGDIGNKSSDRPEAYKIVRKNDIVLNSMNLSIGSVGISREDGVTSSVYIIYYAKPKIATTDFFHYLFETPQFQRHLSSYGKGIMELREAVKEISIRNQQIAVPSLNEQKKISEYLDVKTRLINKVLIKKQKLIDLLQEKRSALITHAVTRGLDPKAKMKPSGIDWIGNIPEDWTVEKIKNISKINSDTLTEKTSDDYLFNYVDIGNVNSQGMILSLQSYKFANAPSRARRIAKNGDIIISTVRTYLKAIARISNPTDLVFSTGFAVVHPTKVNSNQLFWSMQSDTFLSQVTAYSTGISYPSIKETILGNLSIPIPTKIDQKIICDYLDKKTKSIDNIINKINMQVEKLSEYRSSLIYHAVTGKIKI